MLTANEAVSMAVVQARPDVISAYPITPQTTIVEKLSRAVEDGLLDSEFITVESEHSALAAVMGASIAGGRTFTATSSHGLLYMAENVFVAGYGRLPIVMAVVNRAISPGWNIWVDHQDSMAMRDAGWIQLYAKNNQEAYDMIFQAYRIAEHPYVQLPVMVCLDGFVLSHTNMPVEINDPEESYKFVGPYKPQIALDTKEPFSWGSLMFPDDFEPIRMNVQDGFNAARPLIKEVAKEYKEKFGRFTGDMLEVYGDPDAKIGIFALATMAEEAMQAVDYLQDTKGLKTNVVRVRVFRPFPHEELVEAASKYEKIIILDRSMSFGNEGHLSIELKSALYDADVKLPIESKVLGIGGKDVSYKDIARIVENLR